jgi:hypothetical protein
MQVLADVLRDRVSESFRIRLALRNRARRWRSAASRPAQAQIASIPFWLTWWSFPVAGRAGVGTVSFP